MDGEESPAYDGSVLQRWVTDSHRQGRLQQSGVSPLGLGCLLGVW